MRGQRDISSSLWRLRKKIGDVRSETHDLVSLGQVYETWGRYAKAVEYHEKSLEIARKIGDVRSEGVTLGNLGLIFEAWGEHAKAEGYFEKSFDIARKIDDEQTAGHALDHLGNVYHALGQNDKALSSFQQELEIYSKIGAPVRGIKDSMGNLYLDMGDLKRAEPLLREGGFWSSLGRLQLVNSDYQGAQEYYEKVRQVTEKNRDVDGLFIAYTGLGTAYEGMGDDKKAEDCFEKAVNLTEDLRSSLPMSQRETFFDVRIGGFLRTAPYDGLARVRIKLNKPLEAFKDSEYTKSRVFAEAMARWSDKTDFNIPADVLKADKELNDQLAALKKKRQGAYEKANQEVISVIEPQVQEMEDQLQAHIRMLREQYPLFAATRYPEPMDLSETGLRNNEWVLTYHVTDPGTIIYLTKGKEIVKALYKPIPRNDLDSLVLKMRKPLEIVPGRDNFKEKLQSFDLVAGKKLSDLLLSDMLGSLPPHVPLLIVPDGSLGILPMEMLVLNNNGIIKTDKDIPHISGADFFGDRNPLSYCQSVTALALSRIYAKSKGSPVGLIAMADPVFQLKDVRVAQAPETKEPQGVLASLFRRLNLMAAEGNTQMGGLRFPRLPLTRKLAKALAAMYRRDSVVYTGFAASKSNFLDNIAPHLNRYDEVVFATHGYLGKDLPGIMEPVLVLTLIPPGTDGYLKMTEVMGLKMNADIVALTACQTGLGKRLAGEGTMGMGRAFQYAGARSVLMSLWSVSEYTSVELVKRFFEHTKSGKTKLESLDLARKEIRAEGFDHPFFWAAFILVGEEN